MHMFISHHTRSSFQSHAMVITHNTMGFSVTMLREVTKTQIQALEITIMNNNLNILSFGIHTSHIGLVMWQTWGAWDIFSLTINLSSFYSGLNMFQYCWVNSSYHI